MEKKFNKREYNLLCANFLEWEQKATFDTKENIWRFNWVDKEGVKHNNLAFDSDWNWIMKVIEKIELLDNFFYFVKIHSGGCFIHLINDTKNYISKQYSANKKEAVVLAIWEFLNWYNKNKNK